MSMFDIDELLKDNSKPVSETAWLGDIDIMEGTLSNFNLDIDHGEWIWRNWREAIWSTL